ncbi:MAG TPA: hypothetical protein PLD55_05475 [bacterium]|nr:hypothetical protein [bacterium]HQB09335.1 hypothetical protein [bacterium]HQM84118.1 hypothetical protein [bacterium]
MKVVFVIFTFILSFSGCSDFLDSSAGKLGEKCFGNGTCRSDLICVDNVCVESIVGENDEDAEKYDDQSEQDSETVDEKNDETDEEDEGEAEFDHDAVDDDDLSDDLSDEALAESDEIPDEGDDTVPDEDADEVPDDAFDCSDAFFGGGTGISSDPYIVSTPFHLNSVRCFLIGHYFRQTSDINLSGYTTGEGWDFSVTWESDGNTNEGYMYLK